MLGNAKEWMLKGFPEVREEPWGTILSQPNNWKNSWSWELTLTFPWPFVTSKEDLSSYSHGRWMEWSVRNSHRDFTVHFVLIPPCAVLPVCKGKKSLQPMFPWAQVKTPTSTADSMVRAWIRGLLDNKIIPEPVLRPQRTSNILKPRLSLQPDSEEAHFKPRTYTASGELAKWALGALAGVVLRSSTGSERWWADSMAFRRSIKRLCSARLPKKVSAPRKSTRGAGTRPQNQIPGGKQVQAAKALGQRWGATRRPATEFTTQISAH